MNAQQGISADTVFQQLFIEMRRYRDLEQRIVTWWTTILLAIMAAFIRFSPHNQAEIPWYTNATMIVFMLALGGAMCGLIKYSNVRYQQLRQNTKKYYNQPAFDLPDEPVVLWERCLLGKMRRIRARGFSLTAAPMIIITLGFCVFLGFI